MSESTAMCPECGSERLYKDGLRYLPCGGSVQRYLCRTCGHRFSKPSKQVNVSHQARRLDSGSQLAETSVRQGNFFVKEVLNNPLFTAGEDIRSHTSRVVEKDLNGLCSYSSKCQIGVTEEKGAKNLASTAETKNCCGRKRAASGNSNRKRENPRTLSSHETARLR